MKSRMETTTGDLDRQKRRKEQEKKWEAKQKIGWKEDKNITNDRCVEQRLARPIGERFGSQLLWFETFFPLNNLFTWEKDRL